MKTTIFNKPFEYGYYVVKKPISIQVDKNFNESKIPKILDICPIKDMSGSFFENEYIRIDLTDHPYTGRIFTPVDNALVETVMSRFIAAVIKKAHLEKLIASDETKMSKLGKIRAQEELDEINDLIDRIGNQKAYVADVVLSYIDNAKTIVSLVDPIVLLLGNDIINLTSPEVTEGHSFIEFKAQDSQFNGALEQLDGRIRAEKKLLLPPSVFSASLNITSSSIYIETDILKVLINNRRLLAGTADMLFNLLLAKDVYYIDEILNRGAILKEILYALSVRYPMLRDQTIQKHEMITSIGDLLITAYGDRNLKNVKIDDINQLSIIGRSKGVQNMFSSITYLQALVIAANAEIQKNDVGEKFVFKNGEHVIMDLSPLGIPKDSNGITDGVAINRVYSLVVAMNAIIHQGLKINNDSGRYSVNVDALLERIIGNFINGNK